jgi:signal transduction histidine kinase
MNRIGTGRLAELFEAAAAVAGQADLRALLYTVVGTATELTEAEYGALGIVGSHGMLVEFLTHGMSEDEIAAVGPPPRGVGVLGTITRMSKTLRLDRIADHPDSVGFPDGHPPMDTFLGVPVRAAGEIFGNLYLTNKAGGFTEADEALVEALALIGGSAVSRLQLQERLRRVALVEERERIARDVHDEIIQDLFAVGLSLQALSLKTVEGEIRSSLESSVRRLDESIAALRGLIFDLRHVPERRDLPGELEELVQELAEAYGCHPDLNIGGDLSEIDDTMAAALFHIVKEGTSNALRHADTTEISVTIMADGVSLVVQVMDNGVGFDPDNVDRGMGLDNLAARAQSSGGTLTIQSAPGRGTTMRFDLPIRSEPAT